ncbi:hypothetical protein KUCAC02_032920 [Chaenocephalus aceratus]|nr:hypothetical protein KUCAC02_032920 [Chaenocephalus aceratus]
MLRYWRHFSFRNTHRVKSEYIKYIV